MKIKLLCLLFFVTFKAFPQTLPLDEAVEQAGVNIAAYLNNDTTVAILSFSSFSEELSAYINNSLTTAILNTGNLRVVSRQRISQIFDELQFQMSGYVSDETAQRIGYMIGAQSVITGSITRIDNAYRLNIQCLEVETALIQQSLDFDIQRDRRMRSFENGGGSRTLNFDSVNLFEDFSPFISLTMIGYSYANNAPIGITVGFGFYTTWNFRFPAWQGYEEDWLYTYNADGNVDGYGNYTYRNKTTNFIMDAVFGYNLNIIPRFLYLPIGFGFRHNMEYRLYDEWNYSNTAISGTSWMPPAWGARYSFLFESGILLKFKLLYLSATYRYINDNTHNFSLGIGICEDFGRIDRLSTNERWRSFWRL